MAGLTSCSSSLPDGRDHFAQLNLVFDGTGSPSQLLVAQSTFGDCRVFDCFRHHLKSFRPLSATLPGEQYTLNVAIRRGSALRREFPPKAGAAAEPPRTECVDVDAKLGIARLEPKVIQEVVRSHFDSLMTCYKSGLARDTALKGRITVRFVIQLDGTVRNARIEANTLPDCEVARCVSAGYERMVFPRPRDGIITVSYPVEFSP